VETNELSKNARGGTELMLERLHSSLSPDLLSKFQIIPSRVRTVDPDKKTILWLHDLPGDNEVEHLINDGWKKYDKLVFVSNWQQNAYAMTMGIPYEAGIVIQNGINPIEDHPKPKDGPIRMVYFSTPHRGLDLLYYAFEAVSKSYPNVELDVFSSFDLYGWPERDKPFEELFEKLKEHPKINYSKSVSNDEIREHLKKCHVFVYPSTWPETSCLCLIEAMSAGLICIHSNLAALPETSRGRTLMYPFTENRYDHVRYLASTLTMVIKKLDRSRSAFYPMIERQKEIVDMDFDWNKSPVQTWNNLLRGMIDEE
jgi:UDP-glucose:(glucosyl)LPS alpha-1,2-glucosyltransferase